MKNILIDDLIELGNNQQQVKVMVDGTLMEGYQIAKPLNYWHGYTNFSDRVKSAIRVIKGKAIAVSYFVDLTKSEQEKYVKEKLK